MSGDLFIRADFMEENTEVGSNVFHVAILDNYPVSEGHTLVIPRMKVAKLRDLPREQLPYLFGLVRSIQKKLDKGPNPPDGYTIGINEGPAAGQTIQQLHVHVIPRYFGDVENPKGGIRNVIPGKGDYKLRDVLDTPSKIVERLGKRQRSVLVAMLVKAPRNKWPDAAPYCWGHYKYKAPELEKILRSLTNHGLIKVVQPTQATLWKPVFYLTELGKEVAEFLNGKDLQSGGKLRWTS